MNWLKDWIGDFYNIFFKIAKWLLEFVIQFAKYVVFTVYDGFLTVISTFLSVIDLSSNAFNIAAQYSNMPSQLIWLINQVNLPQAMAYIVLGITIRMTLNVIPAAVTRI